MLTFYESKLFCLASDCLGREWWNVETFVFPNKGLAELVEEIISARTLNISIAVAACYRVFMVVGANRLFPQLWSVDVEDHEAVILRLINCTATIAAALSHLLLQLEIFLHQVGNVGSLRVVIRCTKC